MLQFEENKRPRKRDLKATVKYQPLKSDSDSDEASDVQDAVVQ